MAGFTDKFSVRVKKEIEKIKNLKGFKNKCSYIWEYYKLYFLGIALAIFCVVSISSQIKANNYNTALCVSFINCTTVDLRDNKKILEDLTTQWLELDGVDNRVSIDGYYSINPNEYNEMTYTSQYKLMAQVAAVSHDCYLSDELFITAYSEAEFFYDLEDLLPAKLLNEVSDRLLYYKDVNGDMQAYAIDLTGYPIIDTLIFSIEKPVFSVVANAPHTDAIITFLTEFINYNN